MQYSFHSSPTWKITWRTRTVWRRSGKLCVHTRLSPTTAPWHSRRKMCRRTAPGLWYHVCALPFASRNFKFLIHFPVSFAQWCESCRRQVNNVGGFLCVLEGCGYSYGCSWVRVLLSYQTLFISLWVTYMLQKCTTLPHNTAAAAVLSPNSIARVIFSAGIYCLYRLASVAI